MNFVTGCLIWLGILKNDLDYQILGALGSCFSFIATTTIIPFMPNGWAASAGGLPAMTERVAFLMKDLVLLVVSVYLLRQDVIRASLPNTMVSASSSAIRQSAAPTGAQKGHG